MRHERLVERHEAIGPPTLLLPAVLTASPHVRDGNISLRI